MKSSTRRNIRRLTTSLGITLLVALAISGVTGLFRGPISTYLSAILLGGLMLNVLLGWWWADPMAALVMVPIIVKEDIEALRGETCCDEGACH